MTRPVAHLRADRRHRFLDEVTRGPAPGAAADSFTKLRRISLPARRVDDFGVELDAEVAAAPRLP